MNNYHPLTFRDFFQKPKSSTVILMLLGLVLLHKMTEKTYEKLISFIVKFSKDGRFVLNKMNAYAIPVPRQRFIYKTSIEVHSIVSQFVLPYYLMTIKSLQYFSQIDFPIVIHEDGSLIQNDINEIHKHIPNATILRFNDATEKICVRISQYPRLVEYRRKKHHTKINLISTIDIPYFAKSQNLFYLDGDILFFHEPTDICEWILDKKKRTHVLFMTDRTNGYALSRRLCQMYFHVDYIEKFNMGILCYNKTLLDLPALNKYFSVLHSLKKYTVPLRDQTYWMICLQKKHQLLKRLNDQYLVPFTKEGDDETICRHYITGIREKIYRDAIILLFRLNLLKR